MLYSTLHILPWLVAAVPGVSAYELNWPRAMYWVGASIITSAVLWGTK
jgi:hypothetical protein